MDKKEDQDIKGCKRGNTENREQRQEVMSCHNQALLPESLKFKNQTSGLCD